MPKVLPDPTGSSGNAAGALPAEDLQSKKERRNKRKNKEDKLDGGRNAGRSDEGRGASKADEGRSGANKSDRKLKVAKGKLDAERTFQEGSRRSTMGSRRRSTLEDSILRRGGTREDRRSSGVNNLVDLDPGGKVSVTMKEMARLNKEEQKADEQREEELARAQQQDSKKAGRAKASADTSLMPTDPLWGLEPTFLNRRNSDGQDSGGNPYWETDTVQIFNVDEVIMDMPLEDIEKRFMLTRWLKARNEHKSKADGNMVFYRLTGVLKVLTGVIVPVCISSSAVFEAPVQLLFSVGAIVFSIVGTTAVALEDFYSFGLRARNRRICQYKMERTFWEFHALAGVYAVYSRWSGPAFRDFIARNEQFMYECEKSYISTFEGDPGSDGVDSGLEESSSSDNDSSSSDDGSGSRPDQSAAGGASAGAGVPGLLAIPERDDSPGALSSPSPAKDGQKHHTARRKSSSGGSSSDAPWAPPKWNSGAGKMAYHSKRKGAQAMSVKPKPENFMPTTELHKMERAQKSHH